ncbi:50S ribosomal protein L1 [Sodalis praecaptivus]
MAKLTKRMRVIRDKVDSTKQYDISEAVALLKELATAKFVESIDVAVNLGIDARKSDQNVRGATVLPHGTGRSIRVAVFTQGANAEAAKAAGADLVGMDDLADQIKKASSTSTWLSLLRTRCALLASWARSSVRAA